MIKKLFRLFEHALQANTKMSASSIVIAGALGTIVFGAYGVLWLYVTPLPHENGPMRLIGLVACLGLWSSRRWPERYRKYLPWLWFSTVTYALPFFSTYQLLASNYSILRSMLEVATMFFIIVIFPNYALASVSLILGMGLGTLAAYLMAPDFWALNHTILLLVHLQVMAYVVVAGMIFMRSHLKGQLAQEKLDTLKTLTTCIAMEMRNPLNQIRFRIDLIHQRIPHPGIRGEDCTISAIDADAIYREINRCRGSIAWGQQVVGMTMDEMGNTPIDKAAFRHLSAAVVTRKAVDEFGYQSVGERARVSLSVREDFIFKGDEARFLYVLFNLLKNAIHYFSEHPQASVTVIVDDQCVTVKDTGPGMKPEVLERVFQPFNSVDKPGSTGLGLSFCHRAMRAFGGRITCTSEPGLTCFVMIFPKVSAKEAAAYEEDLMRRAKLLFQGKEILIVDDAKRLRERTRAVLAPLGATLAEAEDGKQALEMLARNRYEAMVLDLSMPVMDGYDTAETIRRGGVPGLEHMPILVHSGEMPQQAKARLDRIGVDAFIPKEGCKPLELIEALCRAHASAVQRAKTLATSSTLAGKTLLLADGEAFNRAYLRSALQERGMKIIEVHNGHSAVKAMTGATRIDVVLADIHASNIDGLGIARAVRALPSPLCNTPMMAMSPHGKEALFSAAQEAGFDDFIVKPVDLIEIFQKLNQQLMVVVDAEELARVLLELRAKLGSLAGHVEANDHLTAQDVMREIMELASRINARALQEALRAHYHFTQEKGQWPSEDWLSLLNDRFAEVEKRLTPIKLS